MERALILAPFEHSQIDRLSKVVEVEYQSWLDTKTIQDPEELGAWLRRENVSILIVESDFVFEEIFELAPSLKFVGICRGAVNHIDVRAATKHGVVVANTPARNAQAVAEHILGLMFALARNIPTADRYVKEARWQNPVEPYINMRGVELSGRTLGIIGLGAIGKKLADLGRAINMTVLAHDPYVEQAGDGISLVNLTELMSQSDFVSVSVPLTPETEGLLDDGLIDLMKPTSYLINATDASVITQNAIVVALQSGKVAGAAFDVFQTHPVSPDNPLLALDNVILTPHIGGATEETIARHSQMMTDDVLRFLDGKPPLNLVNAEVWERRA